MRRLVQSSTVKRLKKLDAELRNARKRFTDNGSANEPEEVEAIHDLRVSIRRLRQELKVFEAWFEPARVKRIRRRLRDLMERCAAVRNCDIGVEVLRAAGCEDPKLFAGLERERRRTAEVLKKELDRWGKKDRVREWRQHLRIGRPGSKGSVRDNARVLLPAMVEDLFRAGQVAARAGSTHQRMHRLRLKAKRVRYTLELFEGVYEKKTAKIEELLKGLQEKLGAINDCATTLDMIRRDRAAAAAVVALAGAREAEFRTYWKKHFVTQEKARWKAVLNAADRKK